MSEIFRGRIREIVRGSDLAQLSSKKIREQLEQEFKTDLSKRKKEIDDIVMSLLVSESQNEESQNSADDHDESDDDIPTTLNSQQEKRKQPDANTRNKKAKARDSSDDAAETTSKDEELARKLQGEDGTRTRRRHLKGPKKKDKKESKKKESKTSTKKDNMFQKEMVLSQELADIMGVNSMPRSKVVQRMWQIIKERNLSDPSNKQFHICDDQLMKVFGKKRVRTFSMMKYLKTHIKDPDLLTNS
ncbi:protein TRI1-like isoform X2 [Patiria miniata]|uniref:Upstream activation factor subunit spp27 n=1 Tax=Patiria miniata TaxID=46514 RepID=A0A913Z2S0_PATMI|nr:protein TRI1-like isoform X2 [Patiria miniata]